MSKQNPPNSDDRWIDEFLQELYNKAMAQRDTQRVFYEIDVSYLEEKDLAKAKKLIAERMRLANRKIAFHILSAMPVGSESELLVWKWIEANIKLGKDVL